MSKYKGLFTFDVDNHRYVTVGVADGIIDCIGYEPSEPTEPLIKDEKIRKAVRAWAEVNSIEKALYAERPNRSLCGLTDMSENDYSIEFVGWIPTLEDDEEYTIAELCGEEESTLIDITNDNELMDRVLKKSAEMQEETLKKAEEEK